MEADCKMHYALSSLQLCLFVVVLFARCWHDQIVSQAGVTAVKIFCEISTMSVCVCACVSYYK